MATNSPNLFLLFLGPFVFTYLLIPVLRKIIIKQDIFSQPTERDLHSTKIPKLIGVVFYFSITLCSIFLFQIQSDSRLIVLMTGLTIILYVGIMDDIYIMSAWGKIILQLFALGVIIFSHNLYLDQFYGLFGIHDFPLPLAIPFTLFVGVFMINSFNLIDGIDGLAGLLALIMFFCFGFIFVLAEDKFLISLLTILSGSIFAFLRFNFSESRKVFMGDTGSQLLGLIMFYLVLFLTKSEKINNIPEFNEHGELRIIISILLFIIPIIDTASVFIIRIIRKKSPFSSDNAHLHHLILKKMKSHKLTSIILLLFNLFSVLLFFIIYRTTPFVVFSSAVPIYFFLLTFLIIRLNFKMGKDHL